MKDEVRDFTVPIRMTFDEKNTILARAKKAGKNLSQFMRDSAIRLWDKRKTRYRSN